MSTKINIRSPFYIKKTGTVAGGTTATLNLRIWTGDETTGLPSTNTYELSKTGTIDGSNWSAVFEISELVRDYLDITFDGIYSSQVIWVRDVGASTNYLAFDGYGYFDEGINPELSRDSLISNSVVWKPEGENVILPVFVEDTTAVQVRKGGSLVRTISVSDSSNTNAKIKYFGIIGDEADLVRIVLTGDDVDIEIKNMECSQYDEQKITFLNKLGALQEIFFFKKSVETLEASKETYKSNLVTHSFSAAAAYSQTRHQFSDFNVQGKERITLNTGFVSEDYNAPIEELMLSERVWLKRGGTTYPVRPLTKSTTFKTSLNDKMVDYTMEFEYAFDKIQNVR